MDCGSGTLANTGRRMIWTEGVEHWLTQGEKGYVWNKGMQPWLTQEEEGNGLSEWNTG